MISIIGAVGLGADAARSGWAPFLFMIGLINLFLGLVNMLPLLPFDGGHISIAIYEKIRTMHQRAGVPRRRRQDDARSPTPS